MLLLPGCGTYTAAGKIFENMAKKTPKKRIQNRIEKELRTYCRLRDKNQCQKCDRYVTGVSSQMSHVIGRGQNGRLKYDPQNVKILCPECHRWWHANPPESGVWFREYFPQRWQYLQSQRNIHGTISVEWYEERLDYIRGLIDDLES